MTEPHKANYFLIILQWFSSANKDQGMNRRVKNFTESKHLGQHFTGGKISFQPLLRRGTEDAAHGASDLCGNTDGISVHMVHAYRFNETAVIQTEQKLCRILIVRLLFFHYFRLINNRIGGKPFSEVGWKLFHFTEIKDKPFIEIIPELFSAEFLKTALNEYIF